MCARPCWRAHSSPDPGVAPGLPPPRHLSPPRDRSHRRFAPVYPKTERGRMLQHEGETRIMETILTAADGLDGPTALRFGRYKEGFDLRVADAAFPFFQVPPPRLPSLVHPKLPARGLPES